MATDASRFVMAAAAAITNLHPQTLRSYERLGLITPERTPGGHRIYSADDLSLAQEIYRLTALGVSIEGIREVLELQRKLRQVTAERDRLLAKLSYLHSSNLPACVPSSAIVVWRRR